MLLYCVYMHLIKRSTHVAIDVLLRPEDCSCFAVRSAARHISQFYDQFLAPVGLLWAGCCAPAVWRGSESRILSRLKRGGHLTIKAPAKVMVRDRTTRGRNVRPWERDGLIRIEPMPSNRRAKDLRLTDAGEK